MMRLGWVPDFKGRHVVSLDEPAAIDELTKHVDAAIAAGRFSFDTETTGLEVLDNDRMFMASFSWPDERGRDCPCGQYGTIKIMSCAVFIGKRHAEIKLSNQKQVLEQLARLLTAHVHGTMFNSKFDAKMCWVDGVPVENLKQDVMLDLYVLDPGFGDAITGIKEARAAGKLSPNQPIPRNLKDLSTLLLGWPPEERDEVHGWLQAHFGPSKKKWKFNAVPADLVSVYACADTERTLALSYWTEAELKAREQDELAAMETQLALVVAEMELNGLPINVPAMDKAEKEWEALGAKAQDKILELTGLTQLSVMSQDELAHYAWPALQERTGSAVRFAVPEDWDIDALSKFAVRKRGSTTITPVPETGIYGEFCAAVLTKRMADKIVGTYFKPWRATHLRAHDDGTYRLHPDLRQDAADTGRFGCKDPNLQNVPVDARMAGFAQGSGKSLVFVDYSQLEYRVFAHYAGGEVLDKYKNDPSTDFHQALADMLGIKRTPAKTLNFGILYGMGKDKLVRSLSGQMDEAQALQSYNIYHAKFPQAKALYYEAQRRCKERGWIKNLFGRRRHLSKDFAHVAFNTIIQGTAADIVKRAMLRVARVLRGLPFETLMLLQIHDELVFETPTGTEAQLIEAVSGPMVDEPRLNCPLQVDASVCLPGELWKDKHKLAA